MIFMKITRELLDKFRLSESLYDVVPTKRNDYDEWRTKQEEMFPGVTEFRRLAKGIMEQEQDDEGYVKVRKDAFDRIMGKLEQYLSLIDEACEDDKEGNRLHSKSGEFASKKNNTSWSLQDKGCGANKMTPGSNVRRWTKIPCGRAARKQGKNVRCRDGKELPLQ